MNVELDLLTRARDRLIELEQYAVDGPWEVEFTAPTMGGTTWRMRTKGVPGIRVSAVEYQHAPHTAELIVALRGCVPYLIERLEGAIQQAGRPEELPRIADVELAEAILGETEG